MILLKVRELLRGVCVKGCIDEALQELDVTDITSDSRCVKNGSMYISICGLTADGDDFIEDAFKSGAALVVSEKVHSAGRCICVSGVREACARIWSNFCSNPADNVKIIAVTGTNGKTSVAHMVKSILECAGYKTAMIGTINNTLTTPDPSDLYPMLADMANSGVQYVVMEASSHALYFDKLSPIKVSTGVFTNLTPEHLDFHGTMQNYAAAKAKLFGMCKNAVVNYDDGYCDTVCPIGSTSKRITFSGVSDSADITAKNVRNLGTDGIEYELSLDESRVYYVKCGIPGLFTVYNTLAAVGCALAEGIDVRFILSGLRGICGVKGRIERVPVPGAAVFIDYAHTPDALEKLLLTVRGFRRDGQKITLLFGCGGDRDRSKRPLMGAIASRLSDFVIITSDNSRSEDRRSIIDQILRGIDKERPHIVIEDRKEAIEYALDNTDESDIIILAGKGHEEYEIGPQGKRYFSEREIVLSHFTKKKGKHLE